MSRVSDDLVNYLDNNNVPNALVGNLARRVSFHLVEMRANLWLMSPGGHSNCIARESRQAAAETKKNSKNSPLKRHAHNSCCALVYFNISERTANI